MHPTRYAIYYVPPEGSALAAFGSAWLGYDVESGGAVAQQDVDGVDVAEVTAEPRRYGFHGTLKAPFALAEGVSEEALLAQAAALAAALRAAAGPRLMLSAIAGFLALVPDGPAPEVARLAEECLRGFDALRRPAERAAADLTPRQRAHLARWGYPYVLEEFRFHMTLTRRLESSERARIEPHLAARFPGAELVIAGIALCRQQPGGAFTLWRRFSLAGA